jgi:hypothetical protein
MTVSKVTQNQYWFYHIGSSSYNTQPFMIIKVNYMITINLQQRAILGISALLALLVSLTLVFAFMRWRNDWILVHQQTMGAPSLATIDETASMIAAIPNHHLFGQSFSNGAMPVTNLQLRVTGIVKVLDERMGAISKAYISISGQPGKVYHIGDKLPYGVKVYDITPDTVILQNDGRLEKLPLPRKKLKFKLKNIQEFS